MRLRLSLAFSIVLLGLAGLWVGLTSGGSSQSEALAQAMRSPTTQPTPETKRSLASTKKADRAGYVRKRGQRIEAKGWVSVSPPQHNVDPGKPAGKPGKYGYVLHAGGKVLELNVRDEGRLLPVSDGGTAGTEPAFEQGAVVRVSGTASPAGINVERSAVAGPPVVSHTLTPTATRRGLRQYRVAIIRYHFKDQAPTPAPQANIQQTLDQVRDFYLRASSGDFLLSFVFSDEVEVDLPIPTKTTPNGCSVYHGSEAARNAVAAQGFDVESFDQLAFIFEMSTECDDGAGASSFRESYYFHQNSPLAERVAGPTRFAFAHEIGHNLGFAHANAAKATFLGAPVPISNTWKNSEYGDESDVMGTGWEKTFDAPHRAKVGFLPLDRTQDVTPQPAASAPDLTLAAVDGALPDPGGAKQLLRIRRTSVADPQAEDAYLYLDLRATDPRGVYDQFLPHDPRVNGVSVRFGPSYGSRDAVFRVLTSSPGRRNDSEGNERSAVNDPTLRSATGEQDYAVAVGQSMWDPQENITITTKSIVGGVATVQVVRGGPTGVPTTVNTIGDTLYVNAGDNRRNNVVLAEDQGKITVVDAGNPVTAQTGCTQINVQTVSCSKAAVKRASVVLDTTADRTAGRAIADLAAVAGNLKIPVSFDGGLGQDSLEGGPGDDTFQGGPGGSDGSDSDIFAGGGGNDVVTYAGRTEPVRATSIDIGPEWPYYEWQELRFNDGGTGEGDHIRNDIGGVIGGSGADTLALDPNLTLNLTGGAGNDTLTGGPNNDTINARDGGADTVTCGGGADIVYSEAADSLSTDCGAPARVPNVKLVIAPEEGGATSDPTPTFAWSAGSATGITYTCKLENGTAPGTAPMGACNNAYSYIPATALTEGPKVFSLVGTVGGASVTVVRKFSADRTAPTTTLVSTPPAATDASGSTFELSSSDPAAEARFLCSLDEAPFEAPVYTSCSATSRYNSLKPANYRFTAKAIDSAGNEAATPVTYDWTVTPDTIFDGQLSKDFQFNYDYDGNVTWRELRSERPQFTFHATSTDATFWCKVDDAAFAACTSPWRAPQLNIGVEHRFVISAGNAAGPTDPTPWDTTFYGTGAMGLDTLLSEAPDADSPTTDSTPTFAFGAWSRWPYGTWFGNGPNANVQPELARYRCWIDASEPVACDSGSFTPAALPDGSHTFSVYALTNDGQDLERDWTPATRTFTVDTVGPAVQFDAGPANGSDVASSSTSFSFSAPAEPSAPLECKLDAAAWAACTSPKALPGLAYGAHTFSVRGTDAVGNVGASATRTFNVTAPDTTVTGGPAAGSYNNTAPTFTFTATPATGATFECSVTSVLQDAFVPCTSPWSPGVQPAGARIFQIRAKLPSGVVDSTPVMRLLFFDYTAADTVIDSGPAEGATITTDSTSLAFSAPSEPTAKFECKLDAAAWAACTSPKSLSSLADGAHAFRVRSIDRAGNVDQSEAVRNFTVAIPAPDTSITGGPAAGAYVNTATPTFTFDATPAAGATFECSVAGGAWSACTSPWTVPAQTAGSRQFQVRAKGPSGAVDPSPASRTVTFDLSGPTSAFTSGPSAGSTITTASTSFGFGVTGEAAGAAPTSLECKLDTAAWAACTSPKALSDLPNGSHTFAVQGRDAAGNVGTAISRTFTVAQPKVLTVPAPVASPTTASLTSDATLGTAKDWIHWTGNTPASLDRKSGTPLISTWSKLISTQPVTGITGTTTFSWTDAAAGGSAGSPSTTGVYTGSANGRGFRLTVPATSPQTRTLKLWVGLRGASTTDALKAYFTDNVATSVQVSSTSNTTTINRVFTISYRPSKATDTLTVDWYQGGGSTNSNSRAILYAAAVY